MKFYLFLHLRCSSKLAFSGNLGFVVQDLWMEERGLTFKIYSTHCTGGLEEDLNMEFKVMISSAMK